MKKNEQDRAKQYRVEGKSLREIAQKLGVAKSSVSLWVRDVELSQTQKQQLIERGHYREAVELRRKTRLWNEQAKRDKVISEARAAISKISHKELLLIGTML